MELMSRAENRHLTISLHGELDHHAAKEIMEKIDQTIEENLPSKAILDMSGVGFMDSSGIAVVMRAKRRMDAMGGTLSVVNIPHQAAKVLEAAGMNRYVNLI